MATPKEMYYEKRGQAFIKNLRKRNFEAYYCANQAEALEKVISLIPEGATVGWGGATTAQEMGVMKAIHAGNFRPMDRDLTSTPEERDQVMRQCLTADVFITGANGLSLDGQMVNIDGLGNRLAAITYGPKYVIVIAGMNKVEEDLDAAIRRARTVAAPMNRQRFASDATPCGITGLCNDCIADRCMCNQILITRHCNPAGRIKFVIVGEELGF